MDKKSIWLKRAEQNAQDKPFPKNLQTLMKEKNINQGVLSKAIGKTPQTISQYVNGVSSPPYDILVKIADYFDVSLDFLLGRSNDRNMKPSAVDELSLPPTIISFFHSLNEPNSREAKNILTALLDSEIFKEDFIQAASDYINSYVAMRFYPKIKRKYESHNISIKYKDENAENTNELLFPIDIDKYFTFANIEIQKFMNKMEESGKYQSGLITQLRTLFAEEFLINHDRDFHRFGYERQSLVYKFEMSECVSAILESIAKEEFQKVVNVFIEDINHGND